MVHHSHISSHLAVSVSGLVLKDVLTFNFHVGQVRNANQHSIQQDMFPISELQPCMQWVGAKAELNWGPHTSKGSSRTELGGLRRPHSNSPSLFEAEIVTVIIPSSSWVQGQREAGMFAFQWYYLMQYCTLGRAIFSISSSKHCCVCSGIP